MTNTFCTRLTTFLAATTMVVCTFYTAAIALTAPPDLQPTQNQQPRSLQDDINGTVSDINRLAMTMGSQIAAYANRNMTLQQQNTQLSETVKSQADQIAKLTAARDYSVNGKTEPPKDDAAK